MTWQSSGINPATTSPASDISKITNDLGVLKDVIGGTPDAAVPSVWATPTTVTAQSANSGTTAGTSTAYTLAPAQAIAAYAAGQTFWVKFHTASGASPTLQISGLSSPPTLVRQRADGSYANIAANEIPTDHRSRVTLISTTQALVESMPASGVIKRVDATPYTTYTSDTTSIPNDDTIPQSSEGLEILTVAITPQHAANRLLIEGVVHMSADSSRTLIAALFQDSGADAIAVAIETAPAAGNMMTVRLRHEMAAGTTSATTLKVRVGTTSGTFYVNGTNVSRSFGGRLACTLSVTESR